MVFTPLVAILLPISDIFKSVDYFLQEDFDGTEHLGVLSLASNGFATDQNSTPSWIPRWDKNTGSPPILAGSSLRSRWVASKGQRTVLLETGDKTRLVLQGLRISTITEFVISQDSKHGNVYFAMEVWDAKASKLNSYNDIDTLKEAFAQTITAGYKHLEHQEESIDSFHKADLDAYLSHCELLKGESGNICGSFFDPSRIAFPGAGRFAACTQPRVGVTGRYSFIFTSNGQMGHGPETVQVMCYVYSSARGFPLF
ncbi:hypothetical protein B0O99DRAFT_746936 [Bisporella sp. PMI_857]|nr:hypothetical protein B0O99DRAFT_746936 [Bisporella sp. PMI_857]